MQSLGLACCDLDPGCATVTYDINDDSVLSTMATFKMEGMQDADDVTEGLDAVDDPLQVAQVGTLQLVLFQGYCAVLKLETKTINEDRISFD